MRRILTQWLGPWTPEAKVPAGIEVTELRFPLRPDSVGNAREGTARRFRRSRTRRSRGGPRETLILAPGLHFYGADDPRFARFASVLAAAGFDVIAPRIADYARLKVSERAIDDFARAVSHSVALPDRASGKVVLFSISFGSLLALRAACNPELANDVCRVVVFGGYADFQQTIHFCLTGSTAGHEDGKHDPLNRPVVVMNLPELDGYPTDATALEGAWHAYIRATWGDPAYRAGEGHLEVARRFIDRVPKADQELYQLGTGLVPGVEERVYEAVGRAADRTRGFDPRAHFAGIRCPVHIIHGLDDDVIPYTQQRVLAEALAPHTTAHTYLTGLFGHTTPEGGGAQLLKQAPAAVRELRTMRRMVRAISGSI